MENLFNSNDVAEAIKRIDRLTPDSQRQWGTMNVAQMLAHCNIGIETAMGHNKFKHSLMGKLIAPFMRKKALSEKPFGKNSPTDKTYIFPDNLNFEEQKAKLINSLHQFQQNGPQKCTTHPHPFFGHFSPEEWALFQWKHLDHHLRQFGV